MMPSSEKRSISSSMVKISRSSRGDQPMSARKLTIACGRMPCCAYSPTAVAPWRFDSRLPSAPRIIGTWPKVGTSAPSAWYSRICFGVFEM